MPDTYTHGHQESVLRSHRWRTAANSAAYLLPHLRSGLTLLDVGCGPGTITQDLAGLVAPGRVVGLDRAESMIESTAPSGSVEFRVGDLYALDAEDGSFDVVHAHQVLQHLSDPVAALTEMRRVLAPGGLLAVRDSDYGAFVWAPVAPALDRWREIYTEVCRRNDADADAGRHLPEWVAAAGFTGLEVSSSNWTFADADSRTWWGGLWADRTTGSAFAGQAVDYGVASADELADVADGWQQWAAGEDGLFVVVHVEVLARP